jgi:hypothetical protein
MPTRKVGDGGTSVALGTTDDIDPWVLCAEPSPDTMTSVTKSVATALSNSHVSAEVAAAISSQAAMIGLRTQSVTLMRDEAYRICEGYLNRAIDKFMFTILHRRFQNLMLANLAVEQLTGYAKPTTVVIGGTATAAAANDLLQTQAAYDQAVKDATAAKDDVAALQKVYDDNQTVITANDTSSKDAQAKLDQAKTDAPTLAAKLKDASDYQAGRDNNVVGLKKLLDAAHAPTATAGGMTPSVTPPTPSAAEMTVVAGAVERIVTAAVDKDINGDFCLDYFNTHKRGAANSDPVYETCVVHLTKDQLELYHDVVKQNLKAPMLLQALH